MLILQLFGARSILSRVACVVADSRFLEDAHARMVLRRLLRAWRACLAGTWKLLAAVCRACISRCQPGTEFSLLCLSFQSCVCKSSLLELMCRSVWPPKRPCKVIGLSSFVAAGCRFSFSRLSCSAQLTRRAHGCRSQPLTTVAMHCGFCILSLSRPRLFSSRHY